MKLLLAFALGLSISPLPLRHVAQLPGHCLLAATAQIARAVDYEQLSGSYAWFESWAETLQWAQANLPAAHQYLWQHIADGDGLAIQEIPARGAGIIVITRPAGTTHAVSFADGVLYDPKQPASTFYSLEAFLSSTPHATTTSVLVYFVQGD